MKERFNTKLDTQSKLFFIEQKKEKANTSLLRRVHAAVDRVSPIQDRRHSLPSHMAQGKKIKINRHTTDEEWTRLRVPRECHLL
jgi:hypothetical protein